MKPAIRLAITLAATLLSVTALAQQPKERAFLQGHKSGVTALAISTDGKILASGDGRGGLKLWDLDTGKETKSFPITFNNRTGAILSLAISPDGKTLATGIGEVAVWDLATGKKLHGLPFDSILGQNGVTFSPDGKTLIAGGNGKLGQKDAPTIKTWEPTSGKEGEAISFTDRALHFAFLPDSKSVLVGSSFRDRGPQIQLLDLSTGKLKPLWSIPPKGGADTAAPLFAVAPDGKRAAFVFTDGLRAPSELNIADVATSKVQGVLKVSHLVFKMAFTPDGKTLVVGGSIAVNQPGIVTLWDVASKKQRGQIKEPHPFGVGDMVITPDGKTLVTAGSDKKSNGEIKLWDLPAK
jgi:WD40 repeat protein